MGVGEAPSVSQWCRNGDIDILQINVPLRIIKNEWNKTGLHKCQKIKNWDHKTLL